ncbi:MAG TPA: hypothetical protein VGI46_01640 [Candidatus Acidoferrum sp.]|jgi:hypothetical protein
MKIGRLLTGIGGVILLLTGLGHGAKLGQLDAMIQAGGMKAPLDAILRGCWLTLSGEMVAVGVLAIVAIGIDKGARIVLICAAVMVFNVGVLLHFVGPFIGVYLTATVAVLFLAGGLSQLKQAA